MSKSLALAMLMAAGLLWSDMAHAQTVGRLELQSPRQTSAAGQTNLIIDSRTIGRFTTINLASFDFNSVEGVAGAHRRIVSSSYQLCSPILAQIKADKAKYRECIALTVENAIEDASNANLAAFHAALPERKRAHIWKDLPEGWRVNG